MRSAISSIPGFAAVRRAAHRGQAAHDLPALSLPAFARELAARDVGDVLLVGETVQVEVVPLDLDAVLWPSNELCVPPIDDAVEIAAPRQGLERKLLRVVSWPRAPLRATSLCVAQAVRSALQLWWHVLVDGESSVAVVVTQLCGRRIVVGRRRRTSV